MRILTWNVWFGEHEWVERTKALYRELVQRRPEVIALQEVTPQLRSILDGLAGYTLHGGDSIFGYDVMLLTRVGVRRSESIELPSQMGRRVLVVELENGLTVATVHLESTAMCKRERVAQLKIIGPRLAAASEDVILVGDMNFDDAAAAESAVLDARYVDLWPLLRPGDPGFTVDSAVNTMRHDLRGSVQKRIDRAFLRSATWRATSIELLGTQALDDDVFVSDHFGLALELSH